MCSGCEFEREKGDDSSARWIGTSGWAREVVLVSMFGDGGGFAGRYDQVGNAAIG